MSKPTNFSYSNTRISTKQPITVEKGVNVVNNMPATSSGIIGGMSRPNVNLGHAPQPLSQADFDKEKTFAGPFRKAYPMKHWRRQLQVNGKSGKSAYSIGAIDRPGGTVFRGYTDDKNGCKCSISGNNLFITFDNKMLQSTSKTIKPQPATGNNNKIQNDGYIQVGSGSEGYQIQTGVYNTKQLCCSQEKKSLDKIRTSGMMSKSYYNDTKAYLKARCNLFEQKQSIKQISTNTYSSESGNPYQGSTQYSTNNCTNPYQTGRTECQNVTYYNPNNVQFATQGAVDSSTRLAKLNYQTITKNGASFNSAKGAQYATAGKYHGESFSRYFVKNKHSPGVAVRRNGNKQVCDANCTTEQTLSGFWGSF